MVRIVNEEHFLKLSSSEGTDTDTSDRNWTEVYVATIKTFIYYYYDSLEETLNHMKIIKLNRYPGDNDISCFEAMLIDTECLEITRPFNNDHFGYITRIFENTSHSVFGKFRGTRR